MHHVGKVAYLLFERFSREAWHNAPRPPEPRGMARGPGHDPDRVLLAGASVSVGWGVVSHDLGLPGYLARGTSAVTGRGTDIEVHAHDRLDVPAIIAELTPQHISRYDAIVLTPGTREALELMPPRRWRAQITGLLDHIAAGRESAPCVIVVGIPEVLPSTLTPVIRRMFEKRGRAMNAVTREVIDGRPRVMFANGTPVMSAEGFDAEVTYDRAAREIIPVLAEALDHSPDRVRQPVDEEARLAAVEYLQSSATLGDDPRIQQLLATAKDVLHAHSVDFFFVGRDEVRLLAATNETELIAPRANSLSTLVLEYRHGFIVPDLLADPRHNWRMQVAEEPFLRFYAGYPVESPDGHRIGVLAVVDTTTREFSPAELSLLRNFALRAGTLLFDR